MTIVINFLKCNV